MLHTVILDSNYAQEKILSDEGIERPPLIFIYQVFTNGFPTTGNLIGVR